MKWTGTASVLARTIALGAAALMLFAFPGCGHKSVDDSLAAGDLAMQNTKLADAETSGRCGPFPVRSVTAISPWPAYFSWSTCASRLALLAGERPQTSL